MSKFATFARKLFELVAIFSEQTANHNTNIAAEVCKVARKRTSGLTVNIIVHKSKSYSVFPKQLAHSPETKN